MIKKSNRITKTKKIYIDNKRIGEIKEEGIEIFPKFIFSSRELKKITELYDEYKKQKRN